MRLPGDKVVDLEKVDGGIAQFSNDCSMSVGPSNGDDVSAANRSSGRPSFSSP